MHIFYTPDLATDFFILNEEESRHCSKVLRLGPGDHVHLIDGKGGLFEAEITTVDKRHVSLRVISRRTGFGKRNHHLHIAIAPTKNMDRLEWFLEKATEIGIDEITPLLCAHSERRVIKEDRLEKIITAAVKQSLTAYHPVLNAAVNFTDLISRPMADVQLIAHCLDDDRKRFIKDWLKPHQSCIILIGPEGDFSMEELNLALQNDFKPVTLGATRLRTETAALTACFEVNYLNR